MKLKKGERIIKQGNIRTTGATAGVLYLTNQRLFLSLYGLGTMMTKKEFEIPFNELTGVKRVWTLLPRGYFTVEYLHGKKPNSIIFEPTDAILPWDTMRIADEWVAQIRKAAKLDTDKKQE
jgi:hypothetical protein